MKSIDSAKATQHTHTHTSRVNIRAECYTSSRVFDSRPCVVCTHKFLLNSQRKRRGKITIIKKTTHTHTHGKLAAATSNVKKKEEKVISQLPLNRRKAEHQLCIYVCLYIYSMLAAHYGRAIFLLLLLLLLQQQQHIIVLHFVCASDRFKANNLMNVIIYSGSDLNGQNT